MDRAWWNEYGEGLQKNDAELWTTNREAARVYRLNHINGEPGAVSKRPNSIPLGGNSGFQAVALAIHFGAARVILLGYDMRNAGKLAHWHGNHTRLGNPVPARFREWCGHFETLNRYLPAGVSVINATPDSAIGCFPRMSLRDALLTAPSITGTVQQ